MIGSDCFEDSDRRAAFLGHAQTALSQQVETQSRTDAGEKSKQVIGFVR